MNPVASSVEGTLRLMPPTPCSTTSRVDLDHPNVARVYDYLLGGSAYWTIDCEFGRRLKDQIPQFQSILLAHRQFVGRAVRYLARSGVRQFIDIGAGFLSRDNTHQLAEEVAPDSRVIYVDNEPITVAHVEDLLDEVGDPERHAIVSADLGEPEELWENALATGLLDIEEPIAVFMFSVLQLFKPSSTGNDQAARAMAHYRRLLPVGSYLGVSHVTTEGVPSALELKLRELKRLCDTSYGVQTYCRSRATIKDLLGDFVLVDPGLVWTPQWRPEEGRSSILSDRPSEAAVLAGIGQKQAVPRARQN